MTAAAHRNAFAPALHQMSLWMSINKLIGPFRPAQASLTTVPNSTILKDEQDYLTYSSDGLN
jgi:hypothetical protein